MNTLSRLGTSFVAALLEAWQELRIHRLRVLLSLIGVTIAVASLTTALAGAGMAKQMMVEQLEREGRPAFISTQVWDPSGDGNNVGGKEVSEAFKKTAERFNIEYFSIVAQQYGRSVTFQNKIAQADVMVVDPSYAPIHRLVTTQGRWLESGDAQNLSPAVVADQAMLKSLGLQDKQLPLTVEITGASQNVSVTVVGTAPTQNYGYELDGKLWMLPETYDHWFAAESPLENMSYGMWVPIDTADELARHFSLQMQSELPGYQVDSYRNDYLAWGADESLKQLAMVVSGIAGIILLLGSLSLLNVAMVTMKQRIREVGIRRSFGATTGRVFFSVMMESVVATAVAGGLGVLISVVLVTNKGLINMVMSTQLDQMPAFPVGAALLGMGVSVGVGALTGILPALVAARVKIVDAIRVYSSITRRHCWS